MMCIWAGLGPAGVITVHTACSMYNITAPLCVCVCAGMMTSSGASCPCLPASLSGCPGGSELEGAAALC